MAIPAVSSALGALTTLALSVSVSCCRVRLAGNLRNSSSRGRAADIAAAGMLGRRSRTALPATPLLTASMMPETSLGTASCESVAMTRKM